MRVWHGPFTRYVRLRVGHAPGMRERFPRHRWLAIPTCITPRASRTCRDACRDHQLAVSFEVGGGENVPGIPGACANHDCTYLARGPWQNNNSPIKGWDVITHPCPTSTSTAIQLSCRWSYAMDGELHHTEKEAWQQAPPPLQLRN